MTKKVEVPQRVLEKKKDYFDAKQIVELTVNIAPANTVNWFVIALDVGGATGEG
jgi:alkylhydroperoxidase family enzyme